MRGAGEAQPQPAAGIGLVGRPFRPRIDGDAGGERGLIELQRVDIVGQLDPQEDAALWDPRIRPRCRTARRALPSACRAWRAGRASASAHARQNAARNIPPAPSAPSAPEPASVFSASIRDSIVPGRDDEADPQRRRDRFGERADVDDAAVSRSWHRSRAGACRPRSGRRSNRPRRSARRIAATASAVRRGASPA